MKLQLPLTTKWFEMTKTVKTEDYREITPYWVKRLFRDVDKNELQPIIKGLQEGRSIEWVGLFHLHFLKEFTTNTMTLGYPKKGDPERTLIFEHAGIEIGYGNPEWGAPTDRMVFIIKHGKRIEL